MFVFLCTPLSDSWENVSNPLIHSMHPASWETRSSSSSSANTSTLPPHMNLFFNPRIRRNNSFVYARSTINEKSVKKIFSAEGRQFLQ
jgi:hypothetical protein